MNELNQTNTSLQRHTFDQSLIRKFTAFIDASERTIETYTRSIYRFSQYMADNSISTPTREDVLAYRDQLKAQGLKPATIQSYIIALRQFFKWTASEGLYPNIAVQVKGSKIDREHKKDPLTSRQAKTVFQTIKTDTETGARDYALLAVMITGGLRTIEIVRANIEDLRTLGDDTVLYVQGKGHDEKSEYIKIATETERALRAYLTFRKTSAGGDPLFASTSHNNQGERMTTRSISRIVKGHLVGAGLDSDRLTAHSLRHTAATMNLLNGGTLEETQQLLRHSRIDTTMIYLHHLDRAKNQSEERIAAAIFR